LPLPRLPHLQKRLAPATTPKAVAISTAAALVLAFALSGLLFLPYGASPLAAYSELFDEAFGSWRGFGQSLVQATPLILIAQATVVIWRAGLGYIGFEGCFLLGAAATAYVALGGTPGDLPIALPPLLFWPAAFLACFAAGALWAALVGVMRIRLGGNDVLVSLMMNYLAALIVQYLVSGPMRAPGDLPQTPRLPMETWLPGALSMGRAHAGLFIAILASLIVWGVLRLTPLGFELIVSGLNPRAARYGGIAVSRRLMGAMLAGGGLAALAGFCAVLGVQHRLMDGLSGGVGFLGIVVALLARLDPLAVVPTAILYGGLQVGGNAMQRQSGLPTSAVMILESLIVLLILAGDALRHYRVVWPARPAPQKLASVVAADS
jgi:general nucleoside transport system permease protein